MQLSQKSKVVQQEAILGSRKPHQNNVEATEVCGQTALTQELSVTDLVAHHSNSPMVEISLINSTGNAKADAVIRGVIGVLELVFPGRIGGYYLVGSYADGTYVPASDLDVVPIFKGSMTSDEETTYWEVIHHLDLISPIHLGFGLRNEEQSFTQGGVGIKIGSQLLYGDDVRDKIPLWSLDYYLQYMIGAILNSMLSFRGNTRPLKFPLVYPDPVGEFHGYDQPTKSDNGTSEPGTSALFGQIMVLASMLVTLKTGKYNADKSRSYLFYRQHINDEWSDFLETVYEKCKKTWHYRIPVEAPEREALRELCRHVLAFENHFLKQIKPYLLKQVELGNRWAVEQMEKIMFPND